MSNILVLTKGLNARTCLLLVSMVGLLSLSGCAGYWHFNEGKRLLQDNKISEGLSQLQEAVDKNPGWCIVGDAVLEIKEDKS